MKNVTPVGNFRQKALPLAILTIISSISLSACDNNKPGQQTHALPETAAPSQPHTPNSPPTANAGADQTVKAGNAVTLDASNSNDIDGNQLTYRWQQTKGPHVKLEGDDTATPSFTAPKGAKALEFSLSVSDGVSTSDTDIVVINVKQPIPPKVETGTLVTAGKGETVNLKSNITNPSDSDISIAWKQTSGEPVTLSNTDGAETSFTAPNTSGYLVFEVSVADDEGNKTSDTIAVNVGNTAPIAVALASATNVKAGEEVKLSAEHSSDSDGDALSYHWKQVLGTPVKLSDASAIAPTFSAPEEGGYLVFALTASDGEVSSYEDTIHVKVEPTASQETQKTADAQPMMTENGFIAMTSPAEPKLSTLEVKWEAPKSSGHGDAHHEIHWSYEGEGAPSHWGDLMHDYAMCKEGESQSPIDITASPSGSADPIEFHYGTSKLNVINNGHTIQVNYDQGSYMIAGGKRYDLLQFHFHSPSEHAVNGKQADMVAHLVHKSEDGQLAVVGVLFNTGAPNEFLNPIWKSMPTEKGSTSAAAEIDINNLLPTNQRYYNYSGSLTTPPCSEGVNWNVMQTTVSVSADQVKAFTDIFPLSVRPLQALNKRDIYFR